MPQDVLPRPEPAPRGDFGRNPSPHDQPQWPPVPSAPDGAPNILLILTDDIGYGATSTFGGPIPVPTLDALAAAGLRYTAFHTTAMCSPTRAALLTGRNPHVVGTGRITEAATAYDGYTSIMPRSAATVAELLRLNGYSTGLIGKYHNVPDWESGPAGPFDRWPTAMGFEHFYGFLGGGTNQWSPGLYRGTEAIEPPHDDPDYILERDLADQAIAWIRRQRSTAPGKPFFMHYATASGHAPHHAPREWIERFKGRFDAGWDAIREETLARQKAQGVVPDNTVLTERPSEIPAWSALDDDQRRLYSRMIEVYAGMVAHCDHQIGRVIDALRDMGELDNTLVVFIQGDNGASAEGGPHGELNEAMFMNGLTGDVQHMLKHLDELGGPQAYNHYPVGWAHAMDAPFQWFKQVASHFGGTRNGLVMAWPKRIAAQGQVRWQFHHVIDIAPTLLDLLGLEVPSVVHGVPQQPMAGVSMAYSFDEADAPSRRRTQYFELVGNRAIYHDGWVAASGPVELPWSFSMKPETIDTMRWELYHVAEDYSEAIDLAESEPVRLRELQELFWIEAARHHALPILRGIANHPGPLKPSAVRGRSEFTLFPGATRVPPGSSPNLTNRAYRVDADVEIPSGGAQGLLFGQGGRFGGHALYVLQGRLVYHYNLLGLARQTVSSTAALQPGPHVLSLAFTPDGPGWGQGGTVVLECDGLPVGQGRLTRTVPWVLSYVEGMNVGLETGTPVSEDYAVPFAFTGVLRKVRVRLQA